MRKLLLVMLFLLLKSSLVYGAASEDMRVYVRKDIYDVQMQNINTQLERILQKLDRLEATANEISGRLSNLSGRVDGLDARVGDLRNDIYLWLVILGIVIALPFVQRAMQNRVKEERPALTLEDVKRLIEEAKLAGK